MKTRSEYKKETPLRRSVNREPAPAGSKDVEVRQLIAVRAYKLYRERGCCDGRDLDDWLEAEQAILGHEGKRESFGSSVL